MSKIIATTTSRTRTPRALPPRQKKTKRKRAIKYCVREPQPQKKTTKLRLRRRKRPPTTAKWLPAARSAAVAAVLVRIMKKKKEHRLNEQGNQEPGTDNEASAEAQVTGLAKCQGACLLFQVDILVLLMTVADTTTIMALLRANILRHYILVEAKRQGANEACLQVDIQLLLTTVADTTMIMVLLRVYIPWHFLLVEVSLQDDGNGE